MARDDAAALVWIQKAARQGDAGAQHNLGMRNRRAGFEGSQADAGESRLEAYKWLRLAATQGYQGITGSISFSPGSRVPDKTVTIIGVKDDRLNLAAEVTPAWVAKP